MAITQFITHNAGWKLASLMIAVAIWASIYSGNDLDPRNAPSAFHGSKRTFDLAITVMTSAEDTRNFSVQPRSVAVTVSGSKEALRELEATDLQAFVNLVDVKDARDLRKRILVRTPPGLTTLTIQPPEVVVQRTGDPAASH